MTLLQAISTQRCTPLLGSEVSSGSCPAASEIAADWAQRFEFPFTDTQDLARVAQYVSTEYGPIYPKLEIQRLFKGLPLPGFVAPAEPHAALAALPLPIYITTNCHDFMYQALMSRGDKDPKRERCRWNEPEARDASVLEAEGGYRPTIANPIVFHLNGHVDWPESLVLTEDDYLDFLVRTSQEPDLIPSRIQQALTMGSLLLIGYRLNDLEARVLLRSLVKHLQRNPIKRHVSVQVVAVGNALPQEQLAKAQAYLTNYCLQLDISVFWGTSREFLAELGRRWDDYRRDAGPATVHRAATV